MEPLLRITEAGPYCEKGDFHVDPWKPVERAVITHAHSDHARGGSERYLASKESEPVLRARLGASIDLEAVGYGETVVRNEVKVSLHPAGHVLGSAQVRIEAKGQVEVVSGDYKLDRDPTTTPFEPVRCHRFVTESTFGLPIYRWTPTESVVAEIRRWIDRCRESGKACLLFAYSLGKAQRLLAELGPSIEDPVLTHGAVERVCEAYRSAGVDLPPTRHVTTEKTKPPPGSLILAPPSAQGSPWARKFGPCSTAAASGWMRVRGTRRRRALDRGFVLSDHADWPGLLSAIQATGAERIDVTHGYAAPLVRWLREHGCSAEILPTRYEGDVGEEAVE